MAQCELVWSFTDQFEGGQCSAGPAYGEREESQCRLCRTHADKGDFDALRFREELHHRSRDDTERAFGADKQILQVVAGVVFLELAQVVEHLAGGQNHLHAKAELARIAVSQHPSATSI